MELDPPAGALDSPHAGAADRARRPALGPADARLGEGTEHHILERWLGIGSVQIQTASGAGASDLVIEGVREFTEVRDFLYAKMRGAHPTSTTAMKSAAHVDDDAIALLREIKDDIKAVRESIEVKGA